ncbi:MAG: AI-2E family transporter [Actinobacteria bacterium]|nr:AI-2E family transporter [Actinomycetota bacterium]
MEPRHHEDRWLPLLAPVARGTVLQALGTPAPIAMALWVGLVSQFLPVIGTYIAGVLPVLLTFLDSPGRALVVVIIIAVYQQVENYLFAPRITARTMELHAALAFGSALVGGAVLGPVGAILGLPAAAMIQGVLAAEGERHEVIDDPLVKVVEKKKPTKRQKK